jgi:hypothetical protein
MSLINGVLHFHCKHCGYNTTHATKTHSLFEEQGDSFRLNATHPYVKECAKLNQAYPATASAASCAKPPMASAASTMVSVDRSKLEQTLADFERNSTDPSASQLSEMFRTLFLN